MAKTMKPEWCEGCDHYDADEQECHASEYGNFMRIKKMPIHMCWMRCADYPDGTPADAPLDWDDIKDED